MCQVIQFFLDHGFDVTKNDGCYGAQCLFELTLSTNDRYMLTAIKLFLDAGAKSRTVSPTADESDTPWAFVSMEGSYQYNCEHNHALANLYYAAHKIYQAAHDGKPYDGIDTYEAAAGKRILKVLASGNPDLPAFYSLSLPEFQKDRCFDRDLYFVCDNCVLCITKYGDLWTDTLLPDIVLTDVTESFSAVVNSTIRSFTFEDRIIVKETSHHGQPAAILETDTGKKLVFTFNHATVEREERVAYWDLTP